MSRVVVLGERLLVEGFALAGAEVVAADSAEAARSAWSALGEDVAVVVLTPAAASALAGAGEAPTAAQAGTTAPLRVVMPG
jgi:vacuolar-type H+-ATPase subunit F/Vma7